MLAAYWGSAFVLAAGGLRCLRGREGFLGYSATELVHERDLIHAGDLIYEVVRNPGISLSTRLRLRDVFGDRRLMDVCIRNILEAPGDTGLVVADVSETHPDAAADNGEDHDR